MTEKIQQSKNIINASIIAHDYFSDETRWQSWLDVEAALALAQADIGMIPKDAAKIIAKTATLESLDLNQLRSKIAHTMAPVFALSETLSQVCGDAGAYVHWGATTQNIIETGRLIVLKRVHSNLLGKLAQILTILSNQAQEHAGLVMIGRTNRQNALPITYGFKIAGWIDELIRVAEQLREVEPRLFQLRFGGAIGGFHSFGKDGQNLSHLLAERLNLHVSLVPNRTSVDPLIEYITKLSMLGVVISRVSGELYLMMTEEIGEAFEALPHTVIGSSTMPQKVNPKHVTALAAKAHQLKSKGMAALSIPSPSHEGDTVVNQHLAALTAETCTLAINVIDDFVATLELTKPNIENMQSNYELTREKMATEGIMMKLATKIGRSQAHDLIHELVTKASHNRTPLSVAMLECDELVKSNGAKSIQQALTQDANTGQCKEIAISASNCAIQQADKLREYCR